MDRLMFSGFMPRSGEQGIDGMLHDQPGMIFHASRAVAFALWAPSPRHPGPGHNGLGLAGVHEGACRS